MADTNSEEMFKFSQICFTSKIEGDRSQIEQAFVSIRRCTPAQQLQKLDVLRMLHLGVECASLSEAKHRSRCNFRTSAVDIPGHFDARGYLL